MKFKISNCLLIKTVYARIWRHNFFFLFKNISSVGKFLAIDRLLHEEAVQPISWKNNDAAKQCAYLIWFEVLIIISAFGNTHSLNCNLQITINRELTISSTYFPSFTITIHQADKSKTKFENGIHKNKNSFKQKILRSMIEATTRTNPLWAAFRVFTGSHPVPDERANSQIDRQYSLNTPL